MENLFEVISEIKDSNVKIEVYSSLNQHLLDKKDIILWDKTAFSINSTIYDKFREVLKKKTCSFYTLNKRLPYHDFCIGLLCSVGYTLNHMTISKVTPKTFTSAWRSMQIMSENTEDDLKQWIKDRLQDRSSNGYTNSLNINLQNVPSTIRKDSFNDTGSVLHRDKSILMKACSSRNVQEPKDKSSLGTLLVSNEVTSLPEGQLDILRVIHSELGRKCTNSNKI